jgi:hypothetical protein
MNVDSLSSGFKKLWKLVCHMDTLINKNSELQVITFLKYDELFTNLCQDFNITNKKLNALNQNLSSGGTNINQILIERVQDLFSLLSKLRKNDKDLVNLNNNE